MSKPRSRGPAIPGASLCRVANSEERGARPVLDVIGVAPMEIRAAEPTDYATIVTIWRDSARSMDGGVPDLEPQSRLMERLVGNLADGWVLEVAEVGGL